MFLYVLLVCFNSYSELETHCKSASPASLSLVMSIMCTLVNIYMEKYIVKYTIQAPQCMRFKQPDHTPRRLRRHH